MSKISLFLKACKELAHDIKSIDHKTQISIYSHYDADGLAAASIMSKVLYLEGFNFHLRVLERLEYDFLNKISKILPDKSTIIFSDIGTGVIESFSQFKTSQNIYILDHHSIPKEIDLDTNIKFLNPHSYSIDGTVEISAAGIVYFVSIQINQENRKLAPLAIIGALGDRQDQGQYSSLIGLNKVIVDHAKELGIISDNLSLWFYDRSRPLTRILRYSNLSGIENEIEVKNLFEEIKIPITNNHGYRTLYDLNEEECRRLASELIVQYGIDPNEIYKKDYELKFEELISLKDARVFVTKLNACGRLQRPDIAISLCLGDRQTTMRELHLIEKEYSDKIRQSIQWALSENNLKELKAIYFLDGREKINDKLIGTIVSMISTRKDLNAKPIIGCALITTGKLKISIRSSKYQENKINLSKILADAIKTIEPNSEVGGHAAAAGAILSDSFLFEFIEYVNKLILEKI